MTDRPDPALAMAFTVLGKRWNGVLIGAIAVGTVSFSELRRSTEGISDSVLSERLSELVRHRLVSREVYMGPPVRVRYTLADRGRALMPAFDELIVWSRENLLQSEPSSP